MLWFWALAALMAVAAASFVLVPLFFAPSRQASEGREAVNVALFRERLAELRERMANGEIAPDEFAEMELDARRDLLGDALGDAPGNTTSPNDTIEAHRQAPAARWSKACLLAAAVLAPLAAILLYADFGFSRGAIRDHALTERLTGTPPDDPGFRKLVAEFERFADGQEDRSESLVLLARAYIGLGDLDRAKAAYAELVERFPGDPALASHHAEALFIAAGREMTGEVKAAVDRALQLNPRNAAMMEIHAIAALREGDVQRALAWFHRALATGIAGARAEIIRQAMSQLQARLGQGARLGQADGAGGPARAINVTVDAGVEVALPGSSAVFVYARAASGPPAPLAVRRLTLEELPAAIRLDETMEMVPGMGLANFDEVIVVARVSSTGSAKAAPGDFEARSGIIDLTKPVEPVTLLVTERTRSQTEGQ